MSLKMPLAVLMIAIVVSQSAAVAASRPVELKWGELSSHILGREIELVLPEGSRVKGEVEAIRGDELVLDVRNTSNSKAHPKGNATIPRTSVGELSVKESRGKWGRKMGVSLGSLTGATLGGYVAATNVQSAGPGLTTFVAIAAAGSVAGYFVGKAADNRVTRIRVVP